MWTEGRVLVGGGFSLTLRTSAWNGMSCAPSSHWNLCAEESGKWVSGPVVHPWATPRRRQRQDCWAPSAAHSSGRHPPLLKRETSGDSALPAADLSAIGSGSPRLAAGHRQGHERKCSISDQMPCLQTLCSALCPLSRLPGGHSDNFLSFPTCQHTGTALGLNK